MTGFAIHPDTRGDDLAVALEVRAVQEASSGEISDACARAIASWWFPTRQPDTAGYVFAWTGEIKPDANGDTSDLWREVGGRAYDDPDVHLHAWERAALDCLGTYLLNRASRAPVPGWMDLHVT